MGFAVPFIGPAISAIGAIAGRGGGKGARQQSDTLNSAQGGLKDVFNYAMPTAQAGYTAGQQTTNSGLDTTKQGTGILQSPLDYWKRIGTGNRVAGMQALAPEINSTMQQSDAARRQAVASGTARGGGLAAPMAEQKTAVMSHIDNLLFGARNAAQGEIGKIGEATTQAGLSTAQIGQDQVARALQMLGLGSQAQTSIASSANQGFQNQAGASGRTIDALTGAGKDALAAATKKWPKAFGAGADTGQNN